MTNYLLAICFLLGAVQTLHGANIDSHFSVDPEDVQLKELTENMKRVTGAVLGLTEYVMEIRSELKSIREDLVESRSSANSTTVRPVHYYSRPIRDPVEFRRQSLELADKVERLLAMDQSPEVDLAKEELRRTVEKNFLRMLAAILVTGPAHTQERADDIFKLMRSVLNGELDFTPVVQRLPLILRDSETNQFVNLLIALRESERNGGSKSRERLLSSVEVSDVPVQEPSGRQLLGNFPSISTNGQFLNPAQFFNRFQNLQTVNAATNPNNNVNNNVNAVNGVVTNAGVVNPNLNNNLVNGNVNNVNPNGINTINTNGVNGINTNSGQVITDTQNVNPEQTQAQPAPSNQLPTINSILDAMNQTNQLIKEIPNLVEGLQTIVESIEGLFG